MAPQRSRSSTAGVPAADRQPSTAVNALIGAVAGLVLSFVPLSTLLGGAVAGYLEGGTTNDGVRVGAIAGLIMLVPMAFFGLFLVPFVLGFGTGSFFAGFGLLVVPLFVFVAVYTVGLSAVGAILGNYLRYEL